MMWIGFLFRSKAGQAMMVAVVIAAMIAGYKWKISSLQHDLDKAIADKNTIELRHNICEADLGQVKHAVSRQNEMIDNLKVENDRLAKEAEEAVRESFTPPEVIKSAVYGPPGHVEMNKFMKKLEGGLS